MATGIRSFIPTINRQSISLTAGVGLLAQLGRPLVSLITLPLLLKQLGQEGLGVWMIALSLMGMVGFVSSGLSASVVTAVGRTKVDGGVGALKPLISAAMLIAAFWGGIVLVLVVPAALLLDWTALLSLGSPAEGSAVAKLMVALAVLLAFGIVATVPRQVMLGRMHGYLAHLLDFAGVVAGAAVLVTAIWHDSSLWVLGLAFMGPSYLTMFVGGQLYLRRAGIGLTDLRHLDRMTLLALSRDSLRMAGYQGAYAISSQSDLLLIGAILGAPASAAYGVAQRVFSLPILVVSTVNYAQWPAMAKADAAGDQALVARMFRHTLIIGSAVGLSVALLAALAYQSLLSVWLGHTLETDPLILLGMVAWVGVTNFVNTCDSVLRARNDTAFLMRTMIAMAAINLVATLLLLPRIGPAGAIWGSVIGSTLALLLPHALRLRVVYRLSKPDFPAKDKTTDAG